MDSEYAVRPPAPVLQPFTSHYAGFRAHGVTPGTHAGLPSRHAHLIISLGAPIEVLQMPDAAQRAGCFTALVGGLHDAPATVRRGHWPGARRRDGLPASCHFYKTSSSRAAMMTTDVEIGRAGGVSMTMTPHISLAFNGQCEAAFRFYEQRLNGAIAFMLTWGDSPMAAEAPAGWDVKIVHATLKIGDTEISGSDVPPDRYEQPKGFELVLPIDDPATAERLFHALAENGTS